MTWFHPQAMAISEEAYQQLLAKVQGAPPAQQLDVLTSTLRVSKRVVTNFNSNRCLISTCSNLQRVLLSRFSCELGFHALLPTNTPVIDALLTQDFFFTADQGRELVDALATAFDKVSHECARRQRPQAV
jgi:hypothetical protein